MHTIKVNLVGRVDSFTGIGQLLNAFLRTLQSDYDLTIINTREGEGDNSHLPPDLKIAPPFRDIDRKAPISVFTDVLWNGKGDNNWEKVPVTAIKMAYIVFDSTKLPHEWVNILNTHFNCVLVPSRILVDICRDSKVQRPIIYLPLGLDLRPYLKRPIVQPAKDKRYTYGFVGSYEPRKNIKLLLSTFEKIFGLDNRSVRLRVHLSYSLLGKYEPVKLINRYMGTNVNVTFGHVDNVAYQSILDEIDCFVSLSRGEGFSIIPRIFMALGKPVILNDALAHKEICEAPGVQPIHGDIPEPAFYPQIDGRYFGTQFSPYSEDAERAWRDFHERRTEFAAMAEARRNWASQFDYEHVKVLYRNIITPETIQFGEYDAVIENGLCLCDGELAKELAEGYYKSGLVKRGRSAFQISNKRAKREKVVVLAHDGGFFSVFNTLISYLTWTLDRNPDAIVLPDWRIEKMREHWKTYSFTSFCYGREEDGNIFLKLFEPMPYEGIDALVYNDDRKLYYDAVLKDDFNEKNEPLLTYKNAYKLYKRPDFQRWRNWYYKYYSKYIILRPAIRDRVNNIYNNQMKGCFVIGAHVRHPSHGLEQPSRRTPTVELYCKKIDNEIRLARREGKEPFVFLATDQDSVVQFFKKYYGGKLICVENVKRTSIEQDRHFAQQGKEFKKIEGFQIQHFMAASPYMWSTRIAEEVIIDAMLLAHCDVFIHVTSNLATAVAFMNPNMKMVYCE